MDNRSLILSEIMAPDTANFSGNVHGGHVLKLLDQAAYACAVNYCGHNVVTLSVDHVLFKQPIYVGECVSLFANVNYVGNTSMEVGIKVVAKNLMTRVERHAITCYFMMVAVDKDMKPTRIEPLKIHNDLDQRRFDEAQVRREINREYQAKQRSCGTK